MAVTLIEPTDPIDVKQICALIYGQPGARKSSLAQTADNPVTLAFDPGIYRAFGRRTAALFETWADVLTFDLTSYATIVVDTIGMCLDKLSQAIIADNPKHGNRLGGLSLQGYGVLKTQFSAWVTSIRQRGQHLVFIAHEKAEKNGDETYYCPDIVGGSYNTMMNHCDMVGYMHFAQGKRVIDFSPTDQWMAKTPPCGWGQITLPDFGAEPHFLAKLIGEARASMGRLSNESALLAKTIWDWESWLAGNPSLAEINNSLSKLSALTNGVKRQVWHLIQEHALKYELIFEKTAKVFVAKPGEAA